MPQRDTKLQLNNLAISHALNATQGHKHNYQQAIYRSQMMGTILPVYQNWVSVQLSTSYYFGSKCHTRKQAQLSASYYFCSKYHTGVEVQLSRSHISILNDGDDPTCLSKLGFSLAINQLLAIYKSLINLYAKRGMISTRILNGIQLLYTVIKLKAEF